MSLQEDVESWIRQHGFRNEAEKWRDTYHERKPFPHIVIEDFLPTGLAEDILQTFPALDNPIWSDRGSHFVVPGGVASKYELGHKPSFPTSIRNAYDKFFFNPVFIKFVSEVTGIADLHFDYEFQGGSLSGGLNAVEKGGLLVRHADFNFSNDLNMYRAVNILLYLNKDWSLHDGGNLDLWDKDLKGPPTTVVSSFNRCLIFATNSDTFHGYEQVLGENVRRSLNLYLYTKSPAPRVEHTPRKTDWRPTI